MIKRIIVSTIAGAGVLVVIAEIAGFHFFRRLLCSHPREQLTMIGGARMCQRCGKEVTLWE